MSTRPLLISSPHDAAETVVDLAPLLPRPDSVARSTRSIVIPVYNGSATIGLVVEGLLSLGYKTIDEVVLVNDGSADDSERTCRELAARYPDRVTFVQLSRNFGEHAAVTAGFRHARGSYVAVVDDDGQHPPEEVLRLFQAAESGGYDVVYGRLLARRHPWHRRALSRLHNLVACRMLGKPCWLYLSSFKVVNRFLADQIAAYDGSFPYVDGVILQTTRNIRQVDVLHRPRHAGRSGYTLAKLLRLWWRIFLGWSTLPFRFALAAGGIAAISALIAAATLASRGALPEVPSAWLAIGGVLFGGMTLFQLGYLGECLRNVAASPSARRPYVIKYVLREAETHA